MNFCRECGHQVNKNQEICTNCGVRPLNSHHFCQSCGIETRSNQEMCPSCGSLLKSISSNKGSSSNYAGFWIRFLAVFIDGMIIGIPLTIFYVILSFFGFLYMESTHYYYETGGSMLDLLEAIAYLFSALIGIFYFAGMHASKWQATLGKKIVGIKVTDLNGNRISFWRGVGRYFATFISSFILYIGYIMAAFTENKQSLHDKIAGTLVVKNKYSHEHYREW